MEIVKKSLYEFNKTGNVKRGLDLGPFSLRNFTFPSIQELYDYIIPILPGILGTKEIPKDIIRDEYYYVKQEYIDKIRYFLNNRQIDAYNIWGERKSISMEGLHYKLKEMGFEEK